MLLYRVVELVCHTPPLVVEQLLAAAPSDGATPGDDSDDKKHKGNRRKRVEHESRGAESVAPPPFCVRHERQSVALRLHDERVWPGTPSLRRFARHVESRYAIDLDERFIFRLLRNPVRKTVLHVYAHGLSSDLKEKHGLGVVGWIDMTEPPGDGRLAAVVFDV